MKSLTGILFDLILRFRVVVLLGVVVLAGWLGAQSPTGLDSALEIWFLEDDPNIRAYEDFLDRFESDEVVAVALEVDDVFQPDVLRDVFALSDALGSLEGVTEVISLSTAETVRLIESDEGPTLLAVPAVNSPDLGHSQIEQLRDEVHNDQLLANLVGDADRATLILVGITHFPDIEQKTSLGRLIIETCSETLPDRSVHVAGSAVLDEASARYTERDMRIFGPLTLLVVCLVSFLLFRSVVATGLIVTVVAMTLVSTTGLAGLFGLKMNMITVVITPLILAVGTADAVHIIAGFRERLEAGLERIPALRSAFCDLFLPCLMTTTTTAAGLGSLLLTTLSPLRQFGWMGAAAVGFALLYTLTVLPIAYSVLPTPKTNISPGGGILTRILTFFARISWHRAERVAVVSVVLCGLSVVGLTKLDTGADFHRYYQADDPVLVATEYVDEHLGGTITLEVLVEASDVRSPEILTGMENVERYLTSIPGVGTVTSLATITRVLHQRYSGDDGLGLPDDLAGSAQLLELVVGSELLARYMTLDNSAGRLSATFSASRYRELADRIAEIESTVATAFSGTADARITGLGKLFVDLDNYILQSQIRSLTAAFITIALMLFLMFRSLRYGLYALIPNGLPLLFVLGAMGWFSLEIDVATVMIASILMGLIVDDTVHFLARLKLEEHRAAASGTVFNLQTALSRAGVETGRALLTTTIVLAAAFFTLLLASFRINQVFGLLCGTAVCVALLCDLVVLPAVIRIVSTKATHDA